MLLLSLFSHPALACPTIATGTPSALNFRTAQVAIVRENGETTFSVSINPAGAAQDFALVMPVPQILAESDVRTLDGEIFGRLDGYTAPRHVADAGCAQSNMAGASEDAADTGDVSFDADGDVEVEAQYLVGDYEVVILSAEESTGLADWLTGHAYYLPPGADERLGEYIDAGSYFLAAKVASSAAIADGSPLAPLQVHYQSESFAIPIRLAALNSPGEQDMVIYAITPTSGADSGQVGIANYPEFTVPSGCIWGDPRNDDFAATYEAMFTSAWATAGTAAWTTEFAGEWYDCNPCSGIGITEEDLAALGFTGDPYSHHLTRLHARYTPDQAGQDLSLYGSGIYDPKVTSYADRSDYNAECIEECVSDDDGAPPDGGKPELSGCGCDSSAGGAGVLGLAFAGLAAARSRRAGRVSSPRP